MTIHVDDRQRDAALRADVAAGLADSPKHLPAKWLYDERGGALFGEITTLPEYYPTRIESGILEQVARELPQIAPARMIVELGAGDSPKTGQLVAACVEQGSLEAFTGFDIDPESLGRGLAAISERWPQLQVTGVIADMVRDLDLLPDGRDVLVALLGSTIGNFLPEQRAHFYRDVAERIGPGGWLLVGYDLVKDPDIIRAAYDDASGVTARFTGNVLRMLNRELGANFDEAAFRHEANWIEGGDYVRVGLRSTDQQHVRFEALDLDVDFAAGELLHLEVCCKFRRDQVTRELDTAGYDIDAWWSDDRDWFALCLARLRDPAGPPTTDPAA